MSDSQAESQVAPESEPELPAIEAAAWRLGKDGVTISSVVERHVGFFAQSEPDSIYFFAELGSPTELRNDSETTQKVYQALAGVGLSEGQIINAVNQMQSAGILFRERAI